jgi:hypothetical protein
MPTVPPKLELAIPLDVPSTVVMELAESEKSSTVPFGHLIEAVPDSREDRYSNRAASEAPV